MKTLNHKEVREIVQSGHLNLLLGSGCSCDYLTTLLDIEERMNEDGTKEEAQRDYYKQIWRSKAISDSSIHLEAEDKQKLDETKQNYDAFFSFWRDILTKRSLHIVNKQVNLFTTNFDMFAEDSCERLELLYNDGFFGRISPIFSVSNFNRIQRYKSLQFDNISDVPLFNIIKLHGSVSWEVIKDSIVYSKGRHIPKDLEKKRGEGFFDGYKKIAVINPQAEKHFETVLDTNYASMLRKFVLELEKENSVLMIFGFSLQDKHIKELLYGVMKSNPTLVTLFFSYSKYDEGVDVLKEKKVSNLYIISPSDRFTFEKSVSYLSEIFSTPEKNDEE